MKIILLGTAHPYRGGLASYNERLARQLIIEGHQTEIFTFTLQYPGFLFPGKTQYTDAPCPSELKITRLLNSINPFNWIKTGRRIRKMEPEIILIKVLESVHVALLRYSRQDCETKQECKN